MILTEGDKSIETRVYPKKLYFISDKDIKELTPRVPNNFFTKNGYEDSTTKRICFSTDIDKCLMALSQNVLGKEFNVYSPDDISKYKIFKPTLDQVPDSGITEELWIKENVKLTLIGRIKVTSDDGKDGVKFNYGGKYQAELYGWNYEWLSKTTDAKSESCNSIFESVVFI